MRGEGSVRLLAIDNHLPEGPMVGTWNSLQQAFSGIRSKDRVAQGIIQECSGHMTNAKLRGTTFVNAELHV